MDRSSVASVVGALVVCVLGSPARAIIPIDGEPPPPPYYPPYSGYYTVENSVRQVIGHTNLTRMSAGRSGNGHIIAAINSGLHVVVETSLIFFNGGCDLVPDRQQAWDAVAAELAPYVASGAIVAFEPIDEPYWNFGISCNRYGADATAILEEIAATVHRSFPYAAMYMIYASPEIRPGQFAVPGGYNWFGVDCYGAWSTCGGVGMPYLLSTLKAAIPYWAGLVLIGNGVSGPYCDGYDPPNPTVATDRAKADVAYAKSDTQVVAVLTYQYETLRPYCDAVIDLPAVLSVWKGFGTKVMCGETSCGANQGAYISHYMGAGCTGTESYYLPYDGYAYSCRSWNGGGVCGTTRRTVTNRSWRDWNGTCRTQWPYGNTLSNFVTVYHGR